jgi:hypothetical protein
MDATSFVSSVILAVTQSNTLQSIRLRGPTWNLKGDLSALRSACEDHDVDLVVKSYASWPVSSFAHLQPDAHAHCPSHRTRCA